MLKIKDNVDLKELEKFGFERNVRDNGVIKRLSTHYWYIKDKNKFIYLETSNGSYSRCLDDLYDLIQAGLVEKVSK